VVVTGEVYGDGVKVWGKSAYLSVPEMAVLCGSMDEKKSFAFRDGVLLACKKTKPVEA